MRNIVLGVVVLMVAASCSSMGPRGGRLAVSAENPRWFTYRGKAVALFGGGDWGVIATTAIDIREHDEWYARYGANANRVTLFAFCTSVGGLGPWERTGPGDAHDGKPKFDLDHWDPLFWDRLHEYLGDAERRGIVVLLQIWDEPYVEAGPDRWASHPFNPDNTVTPIPGMPGGERSGESAFYDPDNAALMARQDALVQKLLDETAVRYANIIYEIGNEINMDSMTPKAEAWQRHWLDLFDRYERERGIPLLISNDTGRELYDEGGDGFDVTNHHGFSGLDVTRLRGMALADAVAAAVRRDFKRYGRPVINSRPASDPDRVNYGDVVDEDTGRILSWAYFMSGAHVIGFRTTIESWKAGLAAERIMAGIHGVADELDLARFAPDPDIVRGGLCLADPGRTYLVYLPEGGACTLDLGDAQGRFAVTWYDPRTSARTPAAPADGGATRRFSAPDTRDWLVWLAREK